MTQPRTVKLSEMRSVDLLQRWYHDGMQNGKPYAVNSMWTRGRGAKVAGLSECQKCEWIKSEPDAKFNKRGWRHDITESGRTALQQGRSRAS